MSAERRNAMKKLLAILAAAMGIATGAEAVTTNRVTVLNKSGSATSEGSLAYWIKNAPINGNVLEITLIDDPQEPESGTFGGDGGYMLDEPLTILSGQKIVVRCVPNPGDGMFPGYRLLESVTGGQGSAKDGPLIEITGALGAACDAQGKSPFTIQIGGFLRFERVSLENWGDGIEYYIGHSMFANSGALELAHCGIRYYHDQVQGGILRSYTGSTTLFYGCTIDSRSPTRKGDPTRNPYAVDGGAVYSSGGRFTMVNSEGLQRIYAKNGFYFTGSETESLFVNCALDRGFMYDNIADGKHHIIGTILGNNPRLKWENDFNDWKSDMDVPWYQVECSGSGKPVIRDCVIASSGGNVFPTSWEADLVGCIEKETDLTPGDNLLGIAGDHYGSLFEPWVRGGCNIYASKVFTPFPYLSTGAAGAQIWHDAEWRNVVGEDTERFVIRGDAAKATQRLDEDFLGKPISADHRPVPQHIQWNEPTLTVDTSGPGIAMLLAYRFMLSENYDESRAMLGGANLLWGRTTLQDAVEYAVEDWRRGAGNRRLIGADGAYHINFADNLKGKTVSVHGVMRVRDGIKIVIDGEGTTLEVGEPDLGVEGASRIFDVSGGELVLSNLTLKGGCADGSWHFFGSAGFDAYNDVCEGGAIRVGSGFTISGYGVEGKVTVDNCRFEDCTAKNAGGAIYVNGDYCSATVRNSSFVRCGLTDPSSGSGGAIFVGGNTGAGASMGLVVENCNFSECGGSAAKSDAVHIGKRSEVEMTGVVIADGENGGVYVDDSARSAAITNAIIVGKSGPDISGAVAKITGGDIAYGSSSGVIWAEGSRQVTRDEVLAPAAFQEEEVGGVPQAYYALVGEPYPVDISEFTGGGTKTIGDAAVISGTLGSVCKVQIADGATVTLKDATIEGVSGGSYLWAGITCLGDATIVLEGENIVKGFHENYPGIFVPEGKTLTIKGEGSLDTSSNGYGAGIGAVSEGDSCGNIVIEGGTITATGGDAAAGIGGNYEADCGDITITGGKVIAAGGDFAAGIGGGVESGCGSITITGGTVEATGGKSAAGIGGGDINQTIGTVTIEGEACVVAEAGKDAPYSVGAGHDGYDVEVIVGGTSGMRKENPFMYPMAYLAVGRYFKATLAEMGYDVPTNGAAYSVTALGLPAGLKLKYNAAVKNKKGKVVTKAKSTWWIEGVPTAALDYDTTPGYLVITANGKAVTVPLLLQVAAQKVTDLGNYPLGTVWDAYDKLDLPGISSGWTVTGLPKSLKYAAKLVKTEVVKNKKVVSVTTNALPYTVYGKATQAGLFTITAKKKVGSYYETMKYRLLIWPGLPDEMLYANYITNITTMAYVPFEWDLMADVSTVGGVKVAKVTGLPTGLTFAAVDTYGYTNAKKKTGKYLKQTGQTIVGTPTKPGTYTVTFTKNVTTGTGKNKKTVAKTAQMLWTVVANSEKPTLAFNTAGGEVAGCTIGLKYGDLLAFTANATTVTASGLPKGITLVDLGGGNWGFKGYTTKTGTYLVTVKATVNGNTVTQRIALKAEGLPAWAKGTFNGCVVGTDGRTSGLATMAVSSIGKISGKFQQNGKTWTFSAASFTGFDGTAYSVTATAKYTYKVNGKTKVDTRAFDFAVWSDTCGGKVLAECAADSTQLIAYQNLWKSKYKAVGSKLFYTSKKKPYKVFTIKSTDSVGEAIGLTDKMSLSLKVTPAGVVTATLTYNTGKKKSGKVVYYKPTCSTVVVPTSPANAETFTGEVPLYFAPSAANNFTGFDAIVPF